MSRFVDLSIPITNDVISDPEVTRPKITYMTHERILGNRSLCSFRALPKKISPWQRLSCRKP